MKQALFIFSLVAATAFTASASAQTSSFPDVPASHANAEAIAYVRAEGIVEGYPDGTFRPDQTINRAEFVKILIGADYAKSTGKAYDHFAAYNSLSTDCFHFSDNPSVEPRFMFSDVSSEAWYALPICRAYEYYWVHGYPDGTFRPTGSINFVEAAKILASVFDLPADKMPIWYEGYVRALEKKRAIPVSITSFSHSITRGEMAEMIYRLKKGVTHKSSRTYGELAAGGQQNQSWNVYVNASQGLSFSYPPSYTMTTDDVVSRYEDGRAWYRILLEDQSSPQKPRVIVEVNADGYGPFFADKNYILSETSEGFVQINSIEEVQYSDESIEGLGFNPRADGVMLIIPRSIKGMNGNFYSMRFSFEENGNDQEQVFRQIVESMQFMQPVAASAHTE